LQFAIFAYLYSFHRARSSTTCCSPGAS
jgi:hypothetical protein